MRKLLCLASVAAVLVLGFAAEAVTPAKKKSPAKKSAHSSMPAHRKAGSPPARSSASRRGKKGVTTRHATTSRSRQLAPTPERYKEIQKALSAKGYLPQEQANGQWNDASTAALKKFQSDQNLEASGKINSLSLIALGLGPKHETTPASPKAPAPAPANP